MKRQSLRPIVGNWAGGDSFFDREHEVSELMRRIRRGASLSLTAPRRVGKTSVLQEVRRQLDGEMTCVFVDLESSSTAEDAIAEIASKAAKHRSLEHLASAWASWLLGAAEIDLQVAKLDLRDSLRMDWQARGGRLIAELCRSEKPLVLFLDELPVLVACLLEQPPVAGRSPADLFLSWLRRLTQDHKGQLSLVVTGSIGLAPLVARAGLSTTLNVYETMRLEPWPREVTLAALAALATHEALTWETGAAESVYEQLGIGVPYHVQLVFQALAEDALRRDSRRLAPADVARVWNDILLTRPSADLPHWEQRLRKALPKPEYALAIRLLTEASLHEPLGAARAHALSHADPQGALPDPEDALRAVLGALEHDGYLGRHDGGWYFPNRLLRAWWADQYGPLLDRTRQP
jgi:hypothetical protein